MTRIITITALLALSACAIGPPYWDVRKDEPIFDQMVRRSYPDWLVLLADCVDLHGHLTHDNFACMVQRPGQCYYLTVMREKSHDEELTALCNGYRPD